MMSSFILPIFGSAIIFVLYLALAAILIRKYQATGNVGFVWLGVAVIVWPLVARLLVMSAGTLARHSMSHQAIGGNAVDAANGLLAFLNLIEQIIEIGLLIVAVQAFAKKAGEKAA
jgi:hypothetical protein